MRVKALGWVCALAVCLFVVSASAQTTKRTAGGERSITGCLMKSDGGFEIRGDEGTYVLNTDRDLTSYVGKKVRIDGKWETTGTFTTAPVGNEKAETAPAAPAPAAPAAGSPAFVGDLHLHITGTVIGDCETPTPK